LVVAPERRWKRIKVDVRVKIRRWEEPEDGASVVRTYELSEGGMSVYASESFEIGTVMLVEFSLPNASKAMRMRAVVRNRRGFRCGMQFVEVSAAERDEIVRYLAEMEGVLEV
jgi:c-di-GMP-binding flagellar brake protein YcgR